MNQKYEDDFSYALNLKNELNKKNKIHKYINSNYKKDRVILHSDLNNFYATVECLENSKLKDKPVAVCGASELRHGVVLAKNYIAKKYGIKTGDVIWQAKQKCRNLVVITANFEKYMKYSKIVREIYKQYTDMIESFGIDECWLDVSSCTKLFGEGKEIANLIKERIKKEIGLTVSIGVSFNKIFAKLGSDLKKPDAITVITRNNFKQIVYPLTIDNLLYVGRQTFKKLSKLGIITIGDMVKFGEHNLNKLLGKWGNYIYSFATGKECSEVKKIGINSVIKSIGNSTTCCKDLISIDDVKLIMGILCESVANRLRDKNLYGNVVSLGLRYNNLFGHNCERKIDSFTANSKQIFNNAIKIFHNMNLNLPIRSISVSVSNLKSLTYMQNDMFGELDKNLKQQSLEGVIDKIRNKYGYQSIKPAINLIDDKLSALNPKVDNIIHPRGFFG